jgi:hypothetical protein
MKTKKLIFVVLALIGLNSAVIAQQKYALLIAGDYYPGNEIPQNHQWNNGDALDPEKGWDEFWNDTYLMWELLYDDPISKYTNENIEVLFANNEDYSSTFPEVDDRYDAFATYGFNITDDFATKTDVLDALDELALINEEDYVFIWIMSNGGNTGSSSYVYLWGYDPGNPNAGILYDTELNAKLDLIPAPKYMTKIYNTF